MAADTREVDRRARTLAALVEAAPVLGVPVWVLLLVTHPNDYAYMFVLFMPGLVMLGTALVAALAVTLIARRGFVRSHAAGSLRFHGIVALVSLVLLAFGIAALANGTTGAAQSMVMLFGVILPIVETGRAVMYAVGAARGS